MKYIEVLVLQRDNPYFGEVDSKVMQLLASSSDTSFSFQGMKRSLKVHQEKLSRSLNRLVATGMVGKGEGGYTITKKGIRATGSAAQASQALVVGSSYLPGDIDLGLAPVSLKGKWFSGMRWLGSSPTSQGCDLKWVTDDGEIQVKVAFQDRAIEVSLISFPPSEETRARQVALKLHARVVDALYKHYNQDS